MAVNLEAIHVALAAKVKAYIDDDWNVHPHPQPGGKQPRIELVPGEGYLSPWESGTASGLAALSLDLRATFDGGGYESEFKRATRCLSIGTNNGTSLIDAVMDEPRTLGGLVADMIAAPPGSPATWAPGSEEQATVVTVPVVVYVRKTGAKV